MFLRSLTISTPTKVIREIPFHKGLNLIIDESEEQITGNNVGKTTVLRLIDFCLGGDAKAIYADPENKKNEYSLVKDYLIKNKIIITLILGIDPDSHEEDLIITRNFLSRKDIVREINGSPLTEKEFEKKLSACMLPDLQKDKPTFRQVISHNIRYSDTSISNTLKTLDQYTSDAEYETLYLHLFGCDFKSGHDRQQILEKIRTENTYKKRLEKNQTRNEYEVILEWVNKQIEALDKKKSALNINENFEADLQSLNEIKYAVNSISSEIASLNLRKNIISDAKQEFESQKSTIDIKALNAIYQQAASFIPNLQTKFEELVAYHNEMLIQKIKFITQDLPILEKKIGEKTKELNALLSQEQLLSEKITQSDTFEELESIIQELNDLFKRKGECENMIRQISEVETAIDDLNTELKGIDEQLFSHNFEAIVRNQLKKFNRFFGELSNQLYGEQYAITHKIVTNSQGQKMYKFNSFNVNHSSGKKQGEISCFDIAYTSFADEEKISCLHFLLNDKKELVHDNQLIKIAEAVNKMDLQFVASILKDKLPAELNKEEYFVVKLSQNDKLFRIEKEDEDWGN
ncbi:MAG: DUF2326 domain-containing protein [Tannerellaceae bacterium]|jgi:uncharacterized protein YydD (DUF2326 family)|nr:DUF2326 domain-containing protein [Tannerellaceae bacterium]